MHAREFIRSAMVTALDNHPDFTGRVVNGPVFPAYDLALPGVAVFTRNEEIDDEKGAKQALQHRRLEATVQIYAKAETGIDNTLDRLAEIVEQVIFVGLPDLVTLRCIDLVTTEMETNAEAENMVGLCTMVFAVRYLTQKGIPNLIL
jgi:hypothetical protein